MSARIHHYRMLEQIGRSGKGETYLAIDERIKPPEQPVLLATRQSLVLAPEWRCSQARFVSRD